MMTQTALRDTTDANAKLSIHDGKGRSLSGRPYDRLASTSTLIKDGATKITSSEDYEMIIDTKYHHTLEVVLRWIADIQPSVRAHPQLHHEIAAYLPGDALLEVKFEILAVCDSLKLCFALKKQKILRTKLYDVAKGRTKTEITPTLLMHIGNTMSIAEPAMVNLAFRTYVTRFDFMTEDVDHALAEFAGNVAFQAQVEQALHDKLTRIDAAHRTAEVNQNAENSVRLAEALAEHRFNWRNGGFEYHEGLAMEAEIIRDHRWARMLRSMVVSEFRFFRASDAYR